MNPSSEHRSPDSDHETSEEGPTTSLGTIFLGVFGVVSMLAAGILWFSSQNSSPQAAIGSDQIASEAPVGSDSSNRASTAAKAKAKEVDPNKQSGSGTRPPKLILDWIEYSPPGCNGDRNIGVNVIETRGAVDEVTLVWRAKELDIENTRRLQRQGRQWTSYVRGIPADTDVDLLAIATGPGGKTTLGTNISRYC